MLFENFALYLYIVVNSQVLQRTLLLYMYFGIEAFKIHIIRVFLYSDFSNSNIQSLLKRNSSLLESACEVSVQCFSTRGKKIALHEN
jgi:hypothetical protein